MLRKILSKPMLGLACACVAGALVAAPALAQPNEVVIRAPHQSALATVPPFTPEVDASISRIVYYGDLDLRTRGGAQTLRYRVRKAANSGCDELDVQFPIPSAGTNRCYRRTRRMGMEEANYLIGQARGEYR